MVSVLYAVARVPEKFAVIAARRSVFVAVQTGDFFAVRQIDCSTTVAHPAAAGDAGILFTPHRMRALWNRVLCAPTVPRVAVHATADVA